MGALWLPSDDELVVAQREPNLLVPGRKPFGPVQIAHNQRASQISLAFLGDTQRLNAPPHAISYGNGAYPTVGFGEKSAFIASSAAATKGKIITAGTYTPKSTNITVFARFYAVGIGYVYPNIINCKNAYNGQYGFRVFLNDNHDILVDADRVSYGYFRQNAGIDLRGRWHEVIAQFDSANTTARLWLDNKYLGQDTNVAIAGYQYACGIGAPAVHDDAAFWGNISAVVVYDGLHAESLLARPALSDFEPANQSPFLISIPATYPTLSAVEAAAYSASSITPRCDIEYP